MRWSQLSARAREPGAAILARFKLRRCAHVGRAPRVLGRVWVWGDGRVVLGDRVLLDGRACAIELHAQRGAEINLGDDVQVEAGTSLEATGLIRIGARSHLGRFCKLMDNQFHATHGNHAVTPAAGELRVGCDVEIGPHAVLLPGAMIEDGCSVEPCRVVSRRVTAHPTPQVPGHDG